MQSDTGNKALPAPTPSSIGVVVKDVEKTVEFLSSIWDLGSSEIAEFSRSKDDITVGEPFRLKFASVKLGAIILELIQPLEGRSTASQFLETKGEGLLYIGFNLQNYDETVSKLQEHGTPMLLSSIFEGKRFCHFDIKPGGIIAELLEE